jgi:hypothetical protein
MGAWELSNEYWDCSCDAPITEPEKYIHPISEAQCPRCGTKREEANPSHQAEVDLLGIRLFLQKLGVEL